MMRHQNASAPQQVGNFSRDYASESDGNNPLGLGDFQNSANNNMFDSNVNNSMPVIVQNNNKPQVFHSAQPTPVAHPKQPLQTIVIGKNDHHQHIKIEPSEDDYLSVPKKPRVHSATMEPLKDNSSSVEPESPNIFSSPAQILHHHNSQGANGSVTSEFSDLPSSFEDPKILNPDEIEGDEMHDDELIPVKFGSPRGRPKSAHMNNIEPQPTPPHNLGKSPRNLARKSSGSVFEKLDAQKKSNNTPQKSGVLTSLENVKRSIGNGVSNFLNRLSRKSIRREVPDLPKQEEEEEEGALRVLLPGSKTTVAISTVSVQQTPSAAAPIVIDSRNDEPVINQVNLRSNITIKETANHIEFLSPRFNVRYAKQGSAGKLTANISLGNNGPNAVVNAAARPAEAAAPAPFIQGDAKNMFLTPRVKAPNKKKSTVQPGFAANVKLFQAVKENDIALVQQLLSESAEMERQTGDALVDVNFHYGVEGKQTPMHIAAKQNNAAIMEILTSAGADVNAMDALQRTPLHMATSLGAHDCSILLLSHGAKLNVRDHYGNAPFHLSVRGHFFDIAHDFIIFGADINFKRQDGSSSLHETMQRGDIEAFNFFIKLHEEGHRVLFNIKDEMGDTPFLRAVAHGKIAMVDELIKTQKTTRVNFLFDNGKGQNMFHIASANGRAHMLQHLIDKFVPVIGFEEAIKLLNMNDKTSGFTPLHCAAHNDCVEVMKLFLNYHLKHYAATHKTVFQQIFGAQQAAPTMISIDVNNVDMKGNTVIHTLIRRVLHEKADLNIRTLYNLQLMLQCKDIKKSSKNAEGETISSLMKRAGLKTKELLARDLQSEWQAAVKLQPMKFEADAELHNEANAAQVYEDASKLQPTPAVVADALND